MSNFVLIPVELNVKLLQYELYKNVKKNEIFKS